MRADRLAGVLDEEQLSLGVHERGRRAVRDSHPLRGARGSGGEDDPGIVGRARTSGTALWGTAQRHGQVVAKDGTDGRLGEDQLGTLLGIVRVHRHVSSAGRQHTEDCEIELRCTGRDPDAHPVAHADPVPAQRRTHRLDLVGQLAIGQPGGAGVDRAGTRMGMHRRIEDVDQRAADRGGAGDRNNAGASDATAIAGRSIGRRSVVTVTGRAPSPPHGSTSARRAALSRPGQRPRLRAENGK